MVKNPYDHFYCIKERKFPIKEWERAKRRERKKEKKKKNGGGGKCFFAKIHQLSFVSDAT